VKKPLHVSLRVKRSSLVELTVGDRVQLDRLVPSPDGFLAERHGDLLTPGVTTLALAQGHYFFKTLSPAHLKVVHGGVETSAAEDPKHPWPISLPRQPAPTGKGDEGSGEPPPFTFEC
jgi:hypothetical protein